MNQHNLLLIFVTVFLAVSSCCDAVATTRIKRHTLAEQKRYPPRDQPRRRLDHKGSKGKGKSSKGDKDDKDDSSSDGIKSKAPKTSSPTTSAPTASAAPSESPAPSAFPTISSAPTQSPTTGMPSTSPSSVPTTSPTTSPSALPSATPTELPTSTPSVSAVPTASPYTTNSDVSGGALESTCDNPVPTDDISPLISQLFAYQVEIQVDPFGGSDSLVEKKAVTSEAMVHEQLAKALLGDCTYQGDTGVAQFARINMHTPDAIIDVKQEGVCPSTIVCYEMAGDFVGDFFMNLPVEPGMAAPATEDGSSSLVGVGGPPTRRRSLQQIQQTIQDGTLMTEIGELLKGIYENLDTGDGTVFIFKGFTNAAATETLGDVDTTTDREGPDGVAAVENAPQALAEKSNGAIAGVVLGCAAIVLIAVSVLAVRRRNDQSKGFVMDHIALEDDEYYDDDEDDDFYRDDEALSNPNDILADLHDQEEASMAAGTTYSSRKVYVLSDQDSVSASAEYLGSASNYSGRFGTEEPSQTHFVTALSKSSLSDLGPAKSNISSNRSYVAEDTVDL